MKITNNIKNSIKYDLLKKPIKAKKTFFLREDDKIKRLKFYDMIKKKNIFLK